VFILVLDPRRDLAVDDFLEDRFHGEWRVPKARRQF
jgi:hypothetical protein